MTIPRRMVKSRVRLWTRFDTQIKQTLQLADLLGHNANAVGWQVWIALLVYEHMQPGTEPNDQLERLRQRYATMSRRVRAGYW
jgi:hypothetical protein